MSNENAIQPNSSNAALSGKELELAQLRNWMVKVANESCQHSFAQLFEYFTQKITRFGFKQTGDENKAKEVLQETMMMVWQKAHLYNQDKGNVSTWVYTIARNICFDMGRKMGRSISMVGSDDIFEDFMEYQAGELENPEQDLDNNSLLEQLSKLPEQQQQVIKLVYLQDMSQAAVAEHLNLPLGTVKSRVRLGLIKLEQIINKESFGYE